MLLSSWFTRTVQLIDRKTGKTREMLHGFKAPHDAIKLGDGSILVNELGSKSVVRASGEHGKDRSVLIAGLAGAPGGLPTGRFQPASASARRARSTSRRISRTRSTR